MQWACAVLYCHLWLLLPHHVFRHYLIKGTIFGKKLFNMKCVFIFSTTFIWNISRFTKNTARYCHKYETSSCTLFLSDVNETWILSTYFWKNKSLTSNFIKIHPVAAELSHADGRTNTTKLVVAFRNFRKRLTIVCHVNDRFCHILFPTQVHYVFLQE